MQNNTFSGLFVGQNIVRLTTVDSTNSWLKESISNSAPFAEGTVILAEDQYGGRGQLNAKWHSEPGKNLTFSILLKPSFLNVSKQFDLNKAVCVALCDVLSPLLPEKISIKWPNDIYAGDKKIAGILIENIISGNMLKYAIIGIGLNVNQETFGEEIKTRATSVKKILHHDYDLNILLNDICRFIEARYLQLKNKTDLSKQYQSRLYRINELSEFKSGDKIFEGKIVGTSDPGLLQVEVNDKIKEFDLKEIAFR